MPVYLCESVTKSYFELVLNKDELYMYRCVQLASIGAGRVAPNPMVGAVLVYEDRIIGEGYHQEFGGAHAEVNCIASVKTGDRQLINKSVLYVSLEPCAHYGKTPPCTELIIRHGIQKVVVGCRDPFPEVDGKGIETLTAAGVSVTLGVLEKECLHINRRFFTYYRKHRPYIILKWAQSKDGAIALPDASAVPISNVFTNRLVHRWRSEEQSILIGTRTAMLDNPSLTTRLWPGKNPVRLVIDRSLKLPERLNIFDRHAPTIIFNYLKHSVSEKGCIAVNDNWYFRLNTEGNLVTQLTEALYQLGIQSVLVEGGTYLLQSIIDNGVWDEARIITNEALTIPGGIAAPKIKDENQISTTSYLSDRVECYSHTPFLREGTD